MVEFGESQPCVKTLADLTFGIDSYPNIAWINDCRLDLVKDHCPASEPAHNEAHGCSFASGKPFHGCRQSRNQGNVLKKKFIAVVKVGIKAMFWKKNDIS